jgi:hypothetical protein
MATLINPRPVEGWFTFDGIYEAHITDVETAVRIARENTDRNGRAFSFNGVEFTQLFPIIANATSLPSEIIPWS